MPNRSGDACPQCVVGTLRLRRGGRGNVFVECDRCQYFARRGEARGRDAFPGY